VKKWAWIVCLGSWPLAFAWWLVTAVLSGKHENEAGWEWVHPLQLWPVYVYLVSSLVMIGLLLHQMFWQEQECPSGTR
jgi:hypothetical protein